MSTQAYGPLLDPLAGIRTARAFVHLRERLREEFAGRQGSLPTVSLDLNRIYDTTPVQAMTSVERQIVDGQLAVLDEIWTGLSDLQRTVLLVLYGEDVDLGYDDAVRVLLARGVRGVRGALPTYGLVNRCVVSATGKICERIFSLTSSVWHPTILTGQRCA